MSTALNPAASAKLRYCAFISYSHRDHRECARLHRTLESYRIPSSIRAARADGERGLGKVFRDRDELASAASLSDAIQHALDSSSCLIVLCSPAAVASRWVNEEIAYFRRRHADRPVFAFVVDGDPGADPRQRPDQSSIPLNLLLVDPDYPNGELGEPIAADARPVGDGFDIAVLKLIAGMLDVGFDQLRDREQRRRQQRLTLISGMSLILTASFAALAWQAMRARDVAREAQAIAELELTSERQTRAFLLSVFQLADAGEARGNEVTVREVLDRAVERIDATPFSRTAIKSAYLANLGRAYSSLGLNRRAEQLLGDSLDALGEGVDDIEQRLQRFETRVELATLQFDMGDYEAALSQLDILDLDSAGLEQRARAFNVRGDVLSYMERDAEAEAAYLQPLELLDQTALDSSVDATLRGHAKFGLGQLLFFAGRHAEAEARLAEASALLESSLGTLHPRTITVTITRGSNATRAGDEAGGRSFFLSALPAAEKVYDAGSPVLGTLQNNLGRLELQAGALEAAEPLLRAALGSDRKHRRADFDDLAYPLFNLGFIRLMRGDPAEARALLEEGERIALPSKHRMRAVIATYLADLDCTEGKIAEGKARAERALAEAVEDYGAEDWRSAQAELTRAWCAFRNGTAVDRRRAEAALLRIRASLSDASPFRLRSQQQWNGMFGGEGA